MGSLMGRGNDGELFGADNDALNVGWGREWAMLGLTPFSVGGRVEKDAYTDLPSEQQEVEQ